MARATVRSRVIDAATVLTGYVLLVTIVPAHLVVPALGGVGTPANIYALVALLWYVASWLTNRTSATPGTSAPRVALTAFAAAVLVAYVAAAQRGPSTVELQAADRGLIQLTAWASLVVLASAGIRDFTELDKLLRRLVIGGTVMAGIGYAEFITGRDLLAGISLPGLHQNVAPIEVMNRGDFTRPTSTATQPLEFGAVMVLLLPFALQQAFDRRRGGWARRWLPVIAIAGAAPLSISRTSVIGLVVVLAVLLPTWPAERRWPAFGTIIVGLGAVKVIVPGLIGTLLGLFSAMFNGGDSSTKARTMDYSDVLRYVAQRPLTGRGFGTFLPALYRFTDNMYLLALVEIGVFGVLAVALLYVAMMYCGRVGRRRLVDPSRRDLGQSFVAAGAAALVSSATFDTLSFPIFAGVFFLLLGCSGAYVGIARRGAAAAAEAVTAA